MDFVHHKRRWHAESDAQIVSCVFQNIRLYLVLLLYLFSTRSVATRQTCKERAFPFLKCSSRFAKVRFRSPVSHDMHYIHAVVQPFERWKPQLNERWMWTNDLFVPISWCTRTRSLFGGGPLHWFERIGRCWARKIRRRQRNFPLNSDETPPVCHAFHAFSSPPFRITVHSAFRKFFIFRFTSHTDASYVVRTKTNFFIAIPSAHSWYQSFSNRQWPKKTDVLQL